MTRTLPVVLLASAVLFGAAACSGSASAPESSKDTTTTAASGTGSPPSDGPSSEGTKALGGVLALGEEFLLADLLSLGITPVASTATSSDAGWQGMDDFDTDGIEIIANSQTNFEQLAALDVDTVIALDYVVETVGMDKLEALGDVIVAPTGSSPADLAELGKLTGREAQAADLIDELDAAATAAKDSAADGCEVSLATVYSGPTLAAWIAAPNNVAVALEDMGCTLVPSSDDEEADGAGRIYLSLENIGKLSAPQLILEQTPTVEGEDTALEEVEALPLWQQLPAVKADQVTTVDRLGYPGAAGLIRLYGDLEEVVG